MCLQSNFVGDRFFFALKSKINLLQFETNNHFPCELLFTEMLHYFLIISERPCILNEESRAKNDRVAN